MRTYVHKASESPVTIINCGSKAVWSLKSSYPVRDSSPLAMISCNKSHIESAKKFRVIQPGTGAMDRVLPPSNQASTPEVIQTVRAATAPDIPKHPKTKNVEAASELDTLCSSVGRRTGLHICSLAVGVPGTLCWVFPLLVLELAIVCTSLPLKSEHQGNWKRHNLPETGGICCEICQSTTT